MDKRTFINTKNQRVGSCFEANFEFSARVFNLVPIRNGVRVRYLPGGKVQALRSNLDYTLLDFDGRVAFVDTKSFQNDAFTFSQIEPHQLQTSTLYEKRGLVSGFVVHFRKTDVVSFFAAHTILKAGPRSRFEAPLGLVLGKGLSFDLRKLWQAGVP